MLCVRAHVRTDTFCELNYCNWCRFVILYTTLRTHFQISTYSDQSSQTFWLQSVWERQRDRVNSSQLNHHRQVRKPYYNSFARWRQLASVETDSGRSLRARSYSEWLKQRIAVGDTYLPAATPCHTFRFDVLQHQRRYVNGPGNHPAHH